MLAVEIILKKRNGLELSQEEIETFISGLVTGEISQIQAAAFLMAGFIKKFSYREIADLTNAMTNSGKKFNFSSIGKPIIDKHSTGGVGDKVSLLLVPIIAACDICIPMISGRGLGHTGGTVDKLESIENFRIDYNEQELFNLLERNGAFMIGQTAEIAPADKILYQIRDVTATVDSNGLIVASILSKKLAEGLDGLVLDIKTGNGAFMDTQEKAQNLAELFSSITKELSLKFKPVITDMSQVLGNAVGNWLEIQETINALQGNCPSDLKAVTECLAVEMLLLSGQFVSETEALKKIRKVWESGQALEAFHGIIESQEGNIHDSIKIYEHTKSVKVKSNQSGYIKSFDTQSIGMASIILGAGRKSTNDTIDPSAGFMFHKKIGNYVEKGEMLFTTYCNNEPKASAASEIVKRAITISEEKSEPPKLIISQ